MAELTIAKSLNKAYRQVPVDRLVFDGFKAQLRNYYEQISVINTEEKLKGDLMDFLKLTFYGQFPRTAILTAPSIWAATSRLPWVSSSR